MRGKALVQQGGVMVPQDQTPVVTLQKVSELELMFGHAVNFLRCGCPHVTFVIAKSSLEGRQIHDDYRLAKYAFDKMKALAESLKLQDEKFICAPHWEDERGKMTYKEDPPDHPVGGYIRMTRLPPRKA